MQKRLLILAGISGLVAVTAGAFGAHVLKSHLDMAHMEVFKTAVNYQFYHTLATFVATALYGIHNRRTFRIAAILFLCGILLFSGSLYCLSLFHEIAIVRAICGPITPIGGLFFIAGWVFIIFGGFQKNPVKAEKKHE